LFPVVSKCSVYKKPDSKFFLLSGLKIYKNLQNSCSYFLVVDRVLLPLDPLLLDPLLELRLLLLDPELEELPRLLDLTEEPELLPPELPLDLAELLLLPDLLLGEYDPD
jgi:hypothetical protein